jgi:5'-deoxynucleotidase YfbR-like HD superfamily hydrolase
MHDAAEAYIVDVPRPVKVLLENYSSIEDKIMSVIADKFRFQWPMPEFVKEVDDGIIIDEMDKMFSLAPD